MAKRKSPRKPSKLEPPVKKVLAQIVDDDADDPRTPLDDMTPDSVESSEFETTALDENEIRLPALVAPAASSKAVALRDPLSLYLSEIRKYPLLSREEELKLAKKYYETKDPDTAQALVKANLRFVVKIAAEYARFSSRMIDLIQEGNVGLMHAVKEYNPYKGARVITYAVWWIRGYIQEYLMRQFSMVRIGTTANQRKLFYQLQKQREELERMGSNEYYAQLSQKLGIPEDEIVEMSKRLSHRDVSLDKPADPNNEDSISLGSLLKKDDGGLPIDEKLALQEQIELLLQAIEKVKEQLTEKEKIILKERVMSDEPLTLQEIGEKYKITREAVRQNEVRLLNKIKAALGDSIK
jgi:RNA polymerase sigma-32 factor